MDNEEYSVSNDKLDEILNTYTIEVLRKLLKFTRRKFNYYARKSELVNEIKNFIYETTLKKLYDRLNENEKNLLKEVVHNKFQKFCMVPVKYFEAKYKTKFPYKFIERWSGNIPVSYLTFFLFNGVIPIEFREELLSFVPEPEKEIKVDTISTEELEKIEGIIIENTIEEAFYNITLSLRLIKENKIKLSEKTLSPPKGTQQIIKEKLGESKLGFENDFKAFALPLIMLNGEMAVLKGGKLILTAKGEEALKQAPEKVAKELFTKWMSSSSFDEYYRIREIKGKDSIPYHMTSPAERKKLILIALKRLPVNQWISIEEFYMFMRASYLDFEITRNIWKLYLYDREYGNLGYIESDAWRFLQLRYLMVLFFEYLATMGIIDIAYTYPQITDKDIKTELWGIEDMEYLSLYDGLKYFRINELGAYALEIDEEFKYKSSGEKFFQVLNNMEIIVLKKERAYAYKELFLENFAIKISDNVFKFNNETILKAVKEKIKLDKIVDFLQTYSINPLPENVKVFFNDIEERINKLKYDGISHIIEADSEFTANIIVNYKELKDKCYIVNRRYIVVPDKYYDIFEELVEKNGLIVNRYK